MTFGELVQIVPQAIVGLLIIYWFAAQIFPSLRPRNSKDSALATRKDFELLFSKYDSLVEKLQKEFQLQIQNRDQVIEQLVRLTSNNAQAIETLSMLIKNSNNLVQNVVDKINYIQNDLVKVKTILEERKGRRNGR